MKTIKIALSFLLILSSIACSIEDDNDTTSFFFDPIPIEEVMIPDQFIRGETVEIIVSYRPPTTCHSFSGFELEGDANERTVAVINVVINDDNTACESLREPDLRSESFTFTVGLQNTYVFKFWQGKDAEGNNKFLTKEVAVAVEVNNL